MKVCTLTWYRGTNYGSVLQAYALRKAVEQMGYECDILAYHQSKVTSLKKKFLYHNFKASMDFKINEYRTAHQRGGDTFAKGIAHAFNTFRDREMQFSTPCSSRVELEEMNRAYDAFICGSDQIWNPYLFDAVYFLHFVHGDERKIAYAPSFGVGDFPAFSNRRTGSQLKHIPNLSVREERGKEIIRSLTGREAPTVVDPSLLLGKEQWEALAMPTEAAEGGAYIFCYFLSRNPMYEKTIQELSRQHNMPIRRIPMLSQDIARGDVIQSEIGPEKWLTLIRNAAFVMTDSFHCSLFSILFRKNFYVFQRFADGDPKGQNTRIDHLLAVAGLQDRFISKSRESFEPIAAERFDYAAKTLRNESDFSRQWLHTALENVEKRRMAEK